MYTPINPEYIIAYFENPIQFSRFVRIVQLKANKRRHLRKFNPCHAWRGNNASLIRKFQPACDLVHWSPARKKVYYTRVS